MTFSLKPSDLGALIALVLFWSLAFVMLKISVATVPPASAAFIRIVIAATLLWGIMRLMGERLPEKPEHWQYLSLLGIIANVLPFTLVLYGMKQIDSGVGAILMGIMPIITVVLAHFFSDQTERLTLRKSIGVIIGFTAILLLLGPSTLMRLGGQTLAEMAVVCGATCFAIAAVITRRAPDLPIATLSAGIMVASALFSAPVALILDWPLDFTPDIPALLALVWLGVFPTGLATLLYFFIVLRSGTGLLAMSNYLVPISGVLWGALLLGERPSWQSSLALAMVAFGTWLVGSSKSKSRASL